MYFVVVDHTSVVANYIYITYIRFKTEDIIYSCMPQNISPNAQGHYNTFEYPKN